MFYLPTGVLNLPQFFKTILRLPIYLTPVCWSQMHVKVSGCHIGCVYLPVPISFFLSLKIQLPPSPKRLSVDIIYRLT